MFEHVTKCKHVLKVAKVSKNYAVTKTCKGQKYCLKKRTKGYGYGFIVITSKIA